MKILKLASIVLFLTISGCASNPINQELYNTHLTKSFNHSKDKVFSATLAALKELNIGIKKQDRKKGLITTEKAEFFKLVQVTGNQHSASGQTFTATHRYYLKITGNNNSATVKTTRYRMWKNAVEQTELNASWSKENVWDPFFNSIKDHLEED